jgi:SAM-dependent methyltransferase
MPDLHDTSVAVEFYEHRYEEGYMDEWEALKKQQVKEVLMGLGLPEKGKALDFGCGTGVFTRIIKDTLPAWEVYGVEISKVAIKNASRKFPDCTFFTSENGKSYEHQFDLLFSHHVMEHVQSLEETFNIINSYLKPHSSQLHILPCGNPGSYEYNIAILKKNGIEKDRDNRFFFEEPGHLRRMTTDEFAKWESKIGFELKKSFYANQKEGSINWITKASPRFVKKLTNSRDAVDQSATLQMKKLRKKLLPLTYLQFSYSKFWLTKTKRRKKGKDYLIMAVLFLPALVSKYFYDQMDKKAHEEWASHKTETNGSEMFLYFSR